MIGVGSADNDAEWLVRTARQNAYQFGANQMEPAAHGRSVGDVSDPVAIDSAVKNGIDPVRALAVFGQLRPLEEPVERLIVPSKCHVAFASFGVRARPRAVATQVSAPAL